MDIKIELIRLRKKQVDLLEELRKRGYPRLMPCQLSGYINGLVLGPQADTVLELCREIIKEWREV